MKWEVEIKYDFNHKIQCRRLVIPMKAPFNVENHFRTCYLHIITVILLSIIGFYNISC